jgi:glutathione reductase (NADPH)
VDSLDLIVVGGGSGGVRAARIAASLGAKVALVEGARLGGTCVNVGCVPKKLLSYGAHVAHELEEARGFGWTIEGARPDWPTLVARTAAEVARLNGLYRDLLLKAGVEVIEGWAEVEAPGRVRVGERVLAARHTLLATGGRPARLGFAGHERAFVSDDAFALPALPRRLVIVGTGYIGLEFASIFAALGVEVTVLGRSPRLLASFDEAVSTHLCAELEKHGVRFVLSDAPAELRSVEGGEELRTEAGRVLSTDRVMLAVGRTPRTEAFEALGLARGPRGHVAVNERLETSVPGVFAVGDLVGRAELTPVALAEGMALSRHLFGGAPLPALDYANVPTAVFTLPPVAAVGRTEAAARAEGRDVAVFTTSFRPLKHTVSGSTERSFMKLVVDRPTDRVLGVHLVGPDAPEILQGFAVAITCGVTKAQLDRTIGLHPTAAEELVTMR